MVSSLVRYHFQKSVRALTSIMHREQSGVVPFIEHAICLSQILRLGQRANSLTATYASAFIDLSTTRLTRMLEVVTTQHQPPMFNGRRIKLRYAHQGGQNPPIIVIHGKQALKVSQVTSVT